MTKMPSSLSVTTLLLLSKSKKELLQLIVGFAFAQEYVLGYDKMMKGSDNAITANMINKEFTAIKQVFRSSTMRGNATQCWHVKSTDGKEYIIKDSWINIR